MLLNSSFRLRFGGSGMGQGGVKMATTTFAIAGDTNASARRGRREEDAFFF